jgi:hypothetical protein
MSKKKIDINRLNYSNMDLNLYREPRMTGSGMRSATRLSTFKILEKAGLLQHRINGFNTTNRVIKKEEIIRPLSHSKKKLEHHNSGLILKSYLDDNEQHRSMIFSKDSNEVTFDMLDESSLNTTKRLVTKHQDSLKLTDSLITTQNATRLDFIDKILNEEMTTPDQIIANEMYINFKFFEFVTALFTAISNYHITIDIVSAIYLYELDQGVYISDKYTEKINDRKVLGIILINLMNTLFSK